jgi:hypothetical protein
MLCLVAPLHDGVWGSEDTVPRILNLGSRREVSCLAHVVPGKQRPLRFG